MLLERDRSRESFRPSTVHEREVVVLLVVLIVALGSRAVHFFTLLGTAYPKFPLLFDQSDMNTYWGWSQAILAGDWLGRETFHPAFDWMRAIAPQETWYRWWGGAAIFQQAPLYPYWVAAALAASRRSIEFVSLAQLI